MPSYAIEILPEAERKPSNAGRFAKFQNILNDLYLGSAPEPVKATREGAALPREVGPLRRKVREVATGLAGVARRVGFLSRRVGQVARRVGFLSRRVGHVARRIGEVSRRVGFLSRRVGHVARRVRVLSRRVGHVARKVGFLSRRVGEVSREVGFLSRRVGEVSREVGFLSRRVGEVSRWVGEVSREVGDVSREVGALSWERNRQGRQERQDEAGDGQVLWEEGLISWEEGLISRDPRMVSYDPPTLSPPLALLAPLAVTLPIERREVPRKVPEVRFTLPLLRTWPSSLPMKPGEHPEFFRFPAPEGRSRESTIRLDSKGVFTHEGNVVEHPRLALAMHTWIRRHPDDGRYILSNGYDWTYFTVEDAPFTVRSLRQDGDHLVLGLSDATEEAWVPGETRIGPDGALYARVKRALAASGPPFEAKFTRHAQSALEPFLAEVNGRAVVRVGKTETPIAQGDHRKT